MAQTEGTSIKVDFAEDLKKLQEQHKQRMMPLVRFLKKHGLKFKHAACRGIRLQYFRIDMLQQILEKKKQLLDRDPKLMSLAETVKDQLVYFKRPENSQKLRFPQNLVPTQPGTGKFASFKFDTTESKRIYFIVVLMLIVVGVLFPLWPYQLKYGLWLISVALLVAIVSIILLRLVVYTVMASFGISFWLFPNLFGDYGVLDSLRPFYSVSKWQNDVFSIILRVLSFAIFVYYCHSIYVEPEFYRDNFESAKDIVKDVHDWGVNKIKGDIGNFSQRALTMDKILNETADAFKQEQYTNFQVPKEQDETQEVETIENRDQVDNHQEPEQNENKEEI